MCVWGWTCTWTMPPPKVSQWLTSVGNGLRHKKYSKQNYILLLLCTEIIITKCLSAIYSSRTADDLRKCFPSKDCDRNIVSPALRLSSTWCSLQHLLPIPRTPEHRGLSVGGKVTYMWACLGAEALQRYLKRAENRNEGSWVDFCPKEKDFKASILKMALCQTEDQSRRKSEIYQEVDCSTTPVLGIGMSNYISVVLLSLCTAMWIKEIKSVKSLKNYQARYQI